MKLYPKDNKWISLGDNVNYGPWSNECVQILKKVDIKKIYQKKFCDF